MFWPFLARHVCQIALILTSMPDVYVKGVAACLWQTSSPPIVGGACSAIPRAPTAVSAVLLGK